VSGGIVPSAVRLSSSPEENSANFILPRRPPNCHTLPRVTRAEEGEKKYGESQAKANAARADYDKARDLHSRARNAKKNVESAKMVLAGAKLRVVDAARLLRQGD